MKRIKYLGLIMIFIILLVLAINTRIIDTLADTTESTALNAYGYKFTLVMYSGSGAPQQVKNSVPILIAHSSMFDNFDSTEGGAYPTTYGQLQKGGYGLTQILPPPESGTMFPVETMDSGDLSTNWGDLGDTGSGPEGAIGIEGISQDEIICEQQDDEEGGCPADGTIKQKGYNCHAGFNKYKFDMKSPHTIIHYKKSLITYDSNYPSDRIYTDDGITEYSVEHNNYIKVLKDNYFGSRKDIETQFKVKLDDDKINQYYIQVEVVQRIKTGKENCHSIHLATIGPVESKGDIYPKSAWEKVPEGGGKDWCDNIGSNYNKTVVEKNVCKKWTTTYDVDENGKKTKKSTCTGGTGDKCSYYGYEIDQQAGYKGSKETYNIIGTECDGTSKIVVSRNQSSTNSSFLRRAVNTCGSDEGKHQVMDPEDETKPYVDPNTGNHVYEYYIGPDKDRALVGPGSSYKYQLFGSCNSSNPSYEGIRHFYLENMIDCPTGCENVLANYGDRSDEYLKCAENYCEHKVDYDLRGNARKRKKNCLVNNCKYRYGRDPDTKSTSSNNTNLQSIDGCTNSVIDGIASRYGKTELKVFDSKCNVASDNTGHYVPTQYIKGKHVTPCEGDYITDFNGNDSDDKTFDQRTYINSICKLVVDSEFTDTTKIKLAAGLGFTYPIVHGGYEYCTYFINKEQWKFDYATIPARNTKYQRDRMLLILKNYNDEVSKVNPDNSNMTAGTQALKAEGNLDGEGKTNFEEKGFDFSKSTLKTTTNEYKLEALNPETKTTELVVEKNSAGSSMKATVVLQTDDVDQVTMVADRNISTIAINQYTSQSGGRLTYTLKKVCLRTDGTAEVYEAPGNNECYKAGVGEMIHGSSTHYTSFEIKPDVENQIKASVEAKAGDGQTYYNVDETCTYKVPQSDYTCRIKFDSNGTKLGNKQYESSSVTATVVYDIPSSQIAKVEIDDTGNIQEVNGNKITIVNHNSRSVETHNVTGIITLINGETVTCPDNVDLYSGPVCEARCIIEPAPGDTSGKLYNMKTYNANLYYTYTTYHDIPTLTEFNSRKMDSEPYLYMKNIKKSVTNTTNELEIRLDKPLEKGELIVGYVTKLENKKCNAYCYKSNDKEEPDTTPSGDNTEKDCYAKEKNLNQVMIKEYCKTKWANDINGFKDEEDCFKKCRVPCPQKTSDYNTVNYYCDGYVLYGFSDKASCINKCYKPIEDDISDEPYIFRSINVANPFPNSEETEEPYEKGKRIVGTNWRGLSHYITNDENDKTSVTGPNSNKAVEYIIDMTAEDIRQIREDTEKSGEGYKNKRRVYARLDRITTGSTDKVQEYKSSFIRESKFSTLFKNSHGIGSRTIHATYPNSK